MKVHLAQIGLPDGQSCVPRWEQLLAAQPAGRHESTPNPADADIVLFTECHLVDDWRLARISESEIARAFPEKVYVYDERDTPWCRFPGVYVSMPRSGSSMWTVPGSYYDVSDAPSHPADGSGESELLFSFIGSPTAKCRNALYELRHPRAVVERVDGFTFYDAASVDFEARQKRFRQILRTSKFVLCPRGAGTSSIRMYETCAAGRVPVIIADDWLEPIGPDWDSFSVRWPESAVRDLPAYLSSIEHLAPEMGLRAKKAHEQWFAADISITKKLDGLAVLAGKRQLITFPARGIRNQAWRHAGTMHTIHRLRGGLAPLKHSVLHRLPSR